MPYKEVRVPAELVLEHRGVRVYRVYRNDEVDQGPRTYWYGLSPYCSEQAGECFDVRDVAHALDLPWPAGCDWEAVRQVLATAIDRALEGCPDVCGHDFAFCWDRRVTAPPDPVEPAAEFIGNELAAALALVFSLCREVLRLDPERCALTGLAFDPALLSASLDLSERLLGEDRGDSVAGWTRTQAVSLPLSSLAEDCHQLREAVTLLKPVVVSVVRELGGMRHLPMRLLVLWKMARQALAALDGEEAVRALLPPDQDLLCDD